MSFEFDTTHPHYTPSWLSKLVASSVPHGYVGEIIDPACGTGNLLAAAALRLQEGGSAGGVRLLGIDVSHAAVRACKGVLASVAPGAMSSVRVGDFLHQRARVNRNRRRIVLMNPPFLGYGLIPAGTRERLRHELGMSGKFNLSHAFVIKSIRDFKPELLVAVLPSSWVFSRASSFRRNLQELGGEWAWDEVGEPFSRVATHVGVLTWRAGTARIEDARARPLRQSNAPGYEVRQGVATGRDEVFRALARAGFRGGRIVPGVRGRDVGRRCDAPEIWAPPQGRESAMHLIDIANSLSEPLRSSLNSRACVRRRLRTTLEYHESFPQWFLDHPKILLPEVLSGTLRIELDGGGEKLPLRSVFAIKLPDVSRSDSLINFLGRDEVMWRLRGMCPRLSGGAIRLTVDALRSCVNAWLSDEGDSGADRWLPLEARAVAPLTPG